MASFISPKPHNYLVVGVNGTIGSALFAQLQLSGASVWGTTQRSSSANQPSIFYLNLLDSPSTWQFPDVNFDVVYLCAGICRMALCEEDPVGTCKVNIDGMVALARRLSDAGAFIVFLSTNQVFSGQSSFVAEDAVYQPLNEYGRQKSVVEILIRQHCPQSAIVRLTKVVEPNMQMIKNWIDRLKQHQSIEAFHDMVLAPVALRQVVEVLISLGDKQLAGCYQISGAEDVSYLDVANFLAQSLECPSSLVQPVSAIEKGIKKTFLPLFTTLSCSSTIAMCGQKPPHFSDVVHECFDIK